MCPNQGDFGRRVTGLGEDGYVCVSSCSGEGYFVTCLTRLVEVCEKSYKGRSWFSPRLGSRCFHVKILCSHFSTYFRCFTLSEHFTNSPSKQVPSLFSETAKICQHNSPSSCVCVLSNLTEMRKEANANNP